MHVVSYTWHDDGTRTLDDIETMPLSTLGVVIGLDGFQHYAAEPYRQAMKSLDTIDDNYGYDSGSEIVMYFLSNAKTWRGPIAKQVKAELKRRLAA